MSIVFRPIDSSYWNPVLRCTSYIEIDFYKFPHFDKIHHINRMTIDIHVPVLNTILVNILAENNLLITHDNYYYYYLSARYDNVTI